MFLEVLDGAGGFRGLREGLRGWGVWRFWPNFDIKKFNFGGAISYHISHFIILLCYKIQKLSWNHNLERGENGGS